jgi:tRNA(fMet)-specific endonuclease VapC
MSAAPVYLLDTNVILHLVRGNNLGQHLATTFRLLDAVNRPLVSIVSHGELRVIADQNGWGDKKRDALMNALDNLVTVDLNDERVLENYVEVCRACRNKAGGARVISNNDSWIAATTKAANAVLLTTDRDFVHLHPAICSVQFVDPKPYLGT